MDLVLKAGDIDGANKLGVIFSLDPKLFELAADVKLRSRNFSTAIALYKHSRVSFAFSLFFSLVKFYIFIIF